jgi:uncharacterized protein (TIGR04255 family)
MKSALTQEHYEKVPIAEAIVDLRVTLPEGSTVEVFNDLYSNLKDRFPNKKPAYHQDLLYGPDNSFTAFGPKRQIGFVLRSEDNLQAIQATLEGFTFHQLAPCESWKTLNEEAKNLWEIYKEICRPLRVERMLNRYIYQIDIPADGPLIELKDYLNTVPEVAPNFSQKAIKGFFMRVEIPQEDLDATVIINEAIVPPANPDVVSIVLTFTLYRRQVWSSDDEDIWHFLEKLRHRQNELFEATITERTRELIS